MIVQSELNWTMSTFWRGTDEQIHINRNITKVSWHIKLLRCIITKAITLNNNFPFRAIACHSILKLCSVCGQKMNKLRFVKGFHSILEASRWWFLSMSGSCYIQKSPAYDSLNFAFFACRLWKLETPWTIESNEFVKNEILMHFIITVSNHINFFRSLDSAQPDSYMKIMAHRKKA